MGMYTELFITGSISTSSIFFEDIKNFFEKNNEKLKNNPHPLFKTENWDILVTSASYYFQPEPTVNIFTRDKTFYFTLRSDLKNYDNEIEQFFDWISSTDATFFGFSRYEETPYNLNHYFSESQ